MRYTIEGHPKMSMYHVMDTNDVDCPIAATYPNESTARIAADFMNDLDRREREALHIINPEED